MTESQQQIQVVEWSLVLCCVPGINQINFKAVLYHIDLDMTHTKAGSQHSSLNTNRIAYIPRDVQIKKTRKFGDKGTGPVTPSSQNIALNYMSSRVRQMLTDFLNSFSKLELAIK